MENMYSSNKMTGAEFEVLDEWFKFATESGQLDIGVDLIIYLRTSPEKVSENM